MDHAEILHQYKTFRAASKSVSNRLVEMLSKDDIQWAAGMLGVLHGKTIELENEIEASVLMDYAIHDLFRDGRNIVERMLAEKPPTNEVELQVLRAMQKAHHTLFKIETPIPGLGARGFDQIRQTQILLVDIGLGSSAIPGGSVATRVYSPAEGWWMSGGAALPLNAKAQDRIAHDTQEQIRRVGYDMSRHELTTITIRACLAAGASRQMAYVDPGEVISRGSRPAQRMSPKIGRNDPCPCGSGKKYKKCCGA